MNARLATGAALVLLAACGAARAQMQLPGATNGVSAGTPSSSTAGAKGVTPAAPAKPIVVRAPTVETIVGRALAQDGANGAMVFDKAGADLVLSKIVFTGTKISKPSQACSLAVTLTSPLVAAAEGRPAGAFRYTVPLEACTFSIDVLDGAVLVSNAQPTCDFVAADCKVSPGGLWGPTPAEITPQRAKDLERERVRIETTMRADFRALLKRAGKDKAAVKAIAAGQAGFSSDREVTCRDYAQESVHGFCSEAITEARVLELLEQFGDDARERAPRQRSARARPVAVSQPAAPVDRPR